MMKLNDSNNRVGNMVKCVCLLMVVGFSSAKSYAYNLPSCGVSSIDLSKFNQYEDPHPLLYLDERYNSGVFRIFYTKKGMHAIKDTRDDDRSGVPDYIENIAIQANAAYDIYNSLGFKNPLNSSAFNGAKYIGISVYDLEGYNGLSYDKAWSYPKHPLIGQDCGLQIRLSNNMRGFPGTWSIPAHELFHLYQYGYARMKPTWYLEGMARWAEQAIRDSTPYRDGKMYLPSTQNEVKNEVFCESYDVNRLFGRLSVITGSGYGSIPLPGSLDEMTYINHDMVVKDNRFKGVSFVKKVLDRMSKESDIISAEKGWNPYQWKESDQKSLEFYWPVIDVIKNALRASDYFPYEDEVESFLSVKPFPFFNKETECP
uniref:hypothetical protein n=1 Tax=Halomonas sp. TaxID=1486246 RepID=UPI0026323B11|nr:hypothetical protein [Halomonas sp.]